MKITPDNQPDTEGNLRAEFRACVAGQHDCWMGVSAYAVIGGIAGALVVIIIALLTK